MDREEMTQKSKGNKKAGLSAAVRAIIMLTVALALFINNPCFMGIKVVKAATQLAITVDYTDETVNVGVGQSSKFYISSDNKKTWEMIDSGKIDISSYLSTKQVILWFKGNKDTEPVSITLDAEDKSLAPVYKITAGVGRIEFSSSRIVQYRKGANGAWYTATSPMYTAMYETKGVTLYFRTAPTVASRAGKAVTVKIPKRPSAPSVKLDAGKLCITGVKPGSTQYRVGDNLAWTTVPTTTSKTSYLDLSSLLGGSTSGNTAIPAGVIEFRTLGTDKKLNSSVKVMEIPQQATLAATAATLAGTTLTINDTDSSKSYEYTRIPLGTALNFYTAKWTSISSKHSVVIKNASISDRIYVRLKSATDKTTKQVSLPSTYIAFTVSGIS
jgi:hypothetical protein